MENYQIKNLVNGELMIKYEAQNVLYMNGIQVKILKNLQKNIILKEIKSIMI